MPLVRDGGVCCVLALEGPCTLSLGYSNKQVFFKRKVFSYKALQFPFALSDHSSVKRRGFYTPA